MHIRLCGPAALISQSQFDVFVFVVSKEICFISTSSPDQVMVCPACQSEDYTQFGPVVQVMVCSACQSECHTQFGPEEATALTLSTCEPPKPLSSPKPILQRIRCVARCAR